MVGKTLGQYEVAEKVGAGGMGEVYRATDTKLNRTVAIKVLPELLASDAERLARFEREAKLLASLSHGNIATLYDFEHVDGVHFLVMEFVDGDDISQRLARGPMPFNDAAPVAVQIAEALEVAHENGVVHRDLKPSNIKLTADGTVKVLDFGLAKAVEGDGSDSDLSQSPTITAAGTAAGVILGTAAYMSPEQARGRAVDKRTDIWAFGSVLFEMLTGRQVYSGETVSDTIACILQREPDWNALPGNTPPRVKRLLERCLEKEVKRRLRDIGEARIELEDAVADSKVTAAPHVTLARRGPHPIVWGVVGLTIGIVATFFALRLWGNQAGDGRDVLRVAVKPPEEATLRITVPPALSRDGRMMVYSAFYEDGRRLFLRDLGSYDSRMLADIDASNPFFSPDGRWVGFLTATESGTRLMRVSVDGGTPLPVGSVRLGGPSNGTWTQDGYIILEKGLTGGLLAIPESGGEPTQLTAPDSADGEFGHWAPCALPDNDHVLFTSWRTRMDDGRVKSVSRSTGEIKVVVQNGVNPIFVEPGYLLYTLGATLMCAPFDPDAVEVTGDPVPVVDPIQVRISDGITMAAVGGGAFCYYPPGDYDARMVWADLEGHVEPVVPEQRDYDALDISPDGRRIAVDIEENGKSDIWVMDLERKSMTRLTVDGTNGNPIYTPDGRMVTFVSMRRGPFELYSVGASGGTSPERLFPSDKDLGIDCWIPDGRILLYDAFTPETSNDIMQFNPADGSTSAFIQTPFSEMGAQVSPDGRWVSYLVLSSDRTEVYVSPFEGGDRFQVSINGGGRARWAPDSRSLYFVGTEPDELFRVDISTEPSFRAGQPKLIVSKNELGGYIESYDVHPDGKRLVFVVNKDTRGKRVYRVILNFDQELARLEQ